jgi:carboxypeptidase Taq
MNSKIETCKKYLSEVGHLGGVANLLHWDMATYMPEDSIGARSEQMALMSTLIHEKRTSPQLNKLITELETEKLDEEEKAFYREVKKDYVQATALPTSFVEEFTRSSALTQKAWEEARDKNDYKVFQPHLSKMIELSKKKADYLKTGNTFYDSLVDEFEPGMTVNVLDKVLNPLLKESLLILKTIQKNNKFQTPMPVGNFDFNLQKKLSDKVIEYLQMPMKNFRLDQSVHPFSISFHPTDARVTTRYNPKDCTDSFSGTVHECGHSLYELNLPENWFGTPLGSPCSYGIHESQSRLWENMVCKSKAFWKSFYPELQSIFPDAYSSVSRDDFYNYLNAVIPGLIRVDADEVTYNLHIMIRYEVEKAIFNDDFKIAELPEFWNSKYKEYLGISSTTFKDGLMQDVHWSQGAFGYFPSYSLGNLFGAQFYHKAKLDNPNLEINIANGDASSLKNWLITNVHKHGRRYSSIELVKVATGSDFSSQYFIEYLKNKYLDQRN